MALALAIIQPMAGRRVRPINCMHRYHSWFAMVAVLWMCMHLDPREHPCCSMIVFLAFLTIELTLWHIDHAYIWI